MLFSVLDLPCWVQLVLYPVSLVVILYAYSKYKQHVFVRLGIPGPKPVPFLGNIPNLQKDGFINTDLENIKKYGKCYGMFIGNVPTLMVAEPDMIKQICIKEFSSFTDRAQSIRIPEYWRRSVANSDGSHWKFLRATMTPAFSSGKMKKMVSILHKHIDSVLECLEQKMQDRDRVDLEMYKVFSSLAMDVICSAAFGIDVDSQRNPDDPFVKHAQSVLNLSIGGNVFAILPLLFPWLNTVYGWLGIDFTEKVSTPFLFAACKKVISERRNEGGSSRTDLLQLLINANTETGDCVDEGDDKTMFQSYKDRRLTDEEIVANAVVFLLVGSDTTSTVLSWLVYCLATNTECQQKLAEEIERECGQERPTFDKLFQLRYLDMFVSETLRLYTPSVRTNRKALRDVNICGVRIPKDMDVTFSFPALHRHPDFWKDPDTFDPERFSPENKANIVPFSYMPFGVGPRNCVGMRFAMMEMKLTLVTLIQRYRFEVCSQTDVPAKVSKGFFLRSENGMWLTLVKH